MTSPLRDPDRLHEINPASLSAYAQLHGWKKHEPYRGNSDIYVHSEHHDLILPRHRRLLDYARVVARTIEDLAKIEDDDALAIYQRLRSADRDEIRVRGIPSRDGSEPSIRDAADLIGGARSIILTAACQAQEPRPRVVLRPEANKDAVAFTDRISLDYTQPGSFVAIFRTGPVLPIAQPPLAAQFGRPEELGDRKFTSWIPSALTAASTAIERVVTGEPDSFGDSVAGGVSANLCERLAALLEPFRELEFTVQWALTAPRERPRERAAFDDSAIPILRAAAASFREQEPRENVDLIGMVERLDRAADEDDGRINLKTFVDGRAATVTVQLKQSDYRRAIRAHDAQSPISLKGDLERVKSRWQLLGAELIADHASG